MLYISSITIMSFIYYLFFKSLLTTIECVTKFLLARIKHLKKLKFSLWKLCLFLEFKLEFFLEIDQQKLTFMDRDRSGTRVQGYEKTIYFLLRGCRFPQIKQIWSDNPIWILDTLKNDKKAPKIQKIYEIYFSVKNFYSFLVKKSG